MRTFLALCPLLAGCLAPDSLVDSLLDADGDGQRTHVVGGPDCDDANPDVRAGVAEVCGNALDDDCDGATDDVGAGAARGFRDADDDGFGNADAEVVACVLGTDVVANDDDCDDRRADVYPAAPEDCRNSRDDDCDTIVDEIDTPILWWPDADGDGFGTGEARAELSCTPPQGYASRDGDCDDARDDVYPLAVDVPYDGLDSDCLGGSDFDLDDDGAEVDPAYAVPPVTDPTYAPGSVGLDCDDNDPDVLPAASDTWYDGLDQNCDGADDFDQDVDGFPSALWGGDDCDDEDPDRNPGETEVHYDDVDQDCDPANDDDRDGDGYPGRSVTGDCDDGDPDVWASCASCEDFDRDGRWTGCDAYVVRDPDCNDRDDWMWDTCATCRDTDGDGFYAGCNRYSGSFADCDDSNPEAWNTCATCKDADGDGAWAGCNRLVTHVADCDDRLANAWTTCAGCVDLDGDTWGVGTCHGGPADCDDTHGDAWTTCATCVDADDDGSRTGCDRYAVQPYDCADDDPAVGGAPPEILADGQDQDCDGVDLVASDGFGRFVSTAGLDTPACGSRATPCATVEHAARLAAAAGLRAVFVAGGRYAGGATSVSIYGGFDPASWTRDPNRYVTELVDGGEHVLRTTGSKVDLDGLVLRDIAPRASWIGVRAEAWVTNVTDTMVSADRQHGSCRGIHMSTTSVLRVAESTISIDACSGLTAGISDTVEGTSSRLELAETKVSLTTTDDEAYVSAVSVSAAILARDLDVTTDGGGELRVLEAKGPTIILDNSSVVSSGADTECSYTGAYIDASSEVRMLNSFIVGRTCERAVVFRLTAPPAEGCTVELLNTALIGTPPEGGAIIQIDPGMTVTEFSGTHLSAVSNGDGPAMRLAAGVFATLINSYLRSSGMAFEGVSGGFVSRYTHYESDGIVRGGTTLDGVVRDTSEFDACAWSGCVAAESTTTGSNVSDPTSFLGVAPRTGGALHHSGAPLPYSWAEYDLRGVPRAGVPSRGALEP